MNAQAFVTLSQLLATNDSEAYWLIDPTLRDPSQTLPELASCVKHPITVLHPDAGSISTPYLVACPPGLAGDKLHDAMLSIALTEECEAHEPGDPQRRSVAALLLTQQDISDLVAGLSNACVVRDTSGQARIFRYWDPRVASTIINTPSLRDLLPSWAEPVHWIHVTDGGQLHIHHREASHTRSAGRPLVPNLTIQQETALRTLNRANLVKGSLNASTKTKAVSTASALNAVKAIEHTALTREDDIVTLAIERLKQACAIETAPRVQDIMAQCIQHRLPLSAMLAELEQQDWSIIKASTQESIQA